MTDAATLTEPLTHLRLRAGVQKVDRPRGALLVGPDGRTLRVGATVERLFPLLCAGISVDDLVARLSSHPADREEGPGKLESQVGTLVEQLRSVGLLEGGRETSESDGEPSHEAAWSVPIDSLALALSRPLRGLAEHLPRGLAVLGLTMLLGAAALAAGLALVQSSFGLADLFHSGSLVGLALVLLVAMPLHEIGHAVAARAVGVTVTRLAIAPRLGLPRIWVETPQARNLTSPLDRFWIPFGGPAVDLLLAGVTGGLMVVLESRALAGVGSPAIALHAATVVFFYCLVSFGLGTSPVTRGDGSNMLEALLDDEWARRGALLGKRSQFSSDRGLRAYRALAILHTLIFMGLVVWLWLR